MALRRGATAEMEQLVIGKDIVCNNRGVDDYDRVLSVCEADGVEVNAAMIAAGLAWSFRKYAHDYDALEDRVRATD